MKVALNFGPLNKHHSLYDELINYPPENVEYVVTGIDSKKIPKILLQTYRLMKRLSFGFISDYINHSTRKILLRTQKNVDLFHLCNHALMFNKKFVCDCERVNVFVPFRLFEQSANDYSLVEQSKEYIRKLLMQDTCCHIMPWTETAKQSLFALIGSDCIANKTTRVPLAVRIPENHTPIEHESFNVLFLGTKNFKEEVHFLVRGPFRALRVFKEFSKDKKDVNLIFACAVPETFKKKFDLMCKDIKITYLPNTIFPDLEEYVRKCDVLLYPSYMTPAMAFYDAWKYHLPVLTTDVFANEEMLQNGGGIVCKFNKFFINSKKYIPPYLEDIIAFEKEKVDEKLEEDLIKQLDYLYYNREKAKAIGENGFKRISEGDLSIKVRNKLLLDIYENAISQ